MDYYHFLKLFHITTVAISLVLFITRVLLLLNHSQQLDRRFYKLAPHINDSLLLTSALLMLWVANLVPGPDNPWLLVKIIVMIMYIFTGMSIFKLRYNRQHIIFLFIVAILLYFYIIHTAIYKTLNPLAF